MRKELETIAIVMSELVQPQQQLVSEDSVLKDMVLEILRRPSRLAISLREIVRELADRYDGIEVERCLLSLSENGLVEVAYTSGYGIGLRARFSTRR